MASAAHSSRCGNASLIPRCNQQRVDRWLGISLVARCGDESMPPCHQTGGCYRPGRGGTDAIKAVHALLCRDGALPALPAVPSRDEPEPTLPCRATPATPRLAMPLPGWYE